MLIRLCLVAFYNIFMSNLICSAFPIRSDENPVKVKLLSNSALGVIACLLSTICLVLTLSLCAACCRKNKYFEWSRRHPRRILRSNLRNGIGGGHEISIFPPPGIDDYLSSTSNIYFEPLPDITSHLSERNHSSRLSVSEASNLNEDWYAEPYKNFPRNQLQYVRKLGSGWFGQVLEGRAIGIDTDHTSTVITQGISAKSTPVVVKALREDASPREQAFFLQELIPYRDLEHENVLKIVAYCLEAQPLLVLLQFCSKGDLKGVLRKENTLTEVNLLKLAKDAASGLAHMHQHNFIHTDLATRNCLVEDSMKVKIGDYGYSLQLYQEEYYMAESVALPLRWCAPETLHCTETTIEARELTSSANVWSFGVLLWEIFSRGSLPYEELDEDGVIQKVILDKSRILHVPQNSFSSQTKLSELLNCCFEHVEKRSNMQTICDLLSNLIDHLEEENAREFEGRWKELTPCQDQLLENQPNEHNIAMDSRAVEMKFESNFSTNDESLQRNCSPSASLKNLHGSAEDLESRIAAKFGSTVPSWLGLEPGQAMDSFTEEISDAIQRLDEALSEDRSESSTNFSSPEKSSVNFILGKNSLVLNPPLTARTLSDGDEENLTMRLEQGDFSELVRLKSQSVQDFMRLTVVDEGSDSSDKASQPGSYIGEFPVLNHQHHTQEKCFSSESNLKEALRDANFMVELEKLQAEHKFSIISEVSREGMSSIEDSNRLPENFHENLKGKELVDTNNGNEFSDYNRISFLGNNFPPSFEEEGNQRESLFKNVQSSLSLGNNFKKEDTKPEVNTKVDASPDCIVSSRGILHSAPLPDVIAHDGNVKLKTSSDSSVDEDKDVEAEVTLGLENENDKIFPSVTEELKQNSVFLQANKTEINKNEIPNNKQVLESKCDIDTDFVVGQDIIIGALEDYSLELYKSAKSAVTTDANVQSDGTTVQPCLMDNDQHLNDLNQNVLIADSLHKESSIMQPEISKCLELSNVGVLQTKNNDNVDYPKHDTCNDDEDKLCKEFLPSPKENVNAEKPANSLNNNVKKVPSSSLLDGELSLEDSNLNIGKCNNFAESQNINESSQNLFPVGDEWRKAEKDKNVENGEFWELQMAAWQEAAEQTRELLYEAAHPPDSEDDILDEVSKSPDSLASPLKSPLCSSSDRLEDDSDFSDRENNHKETYISYVTEDDDNIRYNSEDLSALRSELNLKLGSVGETSSSMFTEDESENDFVFINYKNSCPSTLSPIREAASEYEQYPSSESSLEFVVGNDPLHNFDKLEDFPDNISPSHFKITLPENNSDKPYDLPSEETKDSLILEDLEYDSSPTSTTIVGPIAPMSDSSEDLLLVDTATNEAKLIGSGRPQSHIAFLVGDEVHSNLRNKQEISRFIPDENCGNKFEDDVDFESLPYEDTNQFSSLGKVTGKTVDDNNSSFVENIEENEAPHYQSYFTSALTSLSHPTPSLDGNNAYESAEHISLPYDVNLEILKTEEEQSRQENASESDLPQTHLKSSSSETVTKPVMPDVSNAKEESFVTLSFLGRLYNNEENLENLQNMTEFNSLADGSQHSSMEQFYSTKSEDSSDNEDIEEELPPECETSQKNNDEPTPLRTPSHLTDFVWRSEAEERYTPEWESDSEDGEANDDMESSSTSGEFIWQPGDSSVTRETGTCLPAADQTSLEWEVANEEKNNKEGEKVSSSPTESGLAEEDCNDNGEDSESGEEEFTPSTWNSELTPNRSLLKSPETNSLQSNKKSVHWKRQRHHRVYEYPPEPLSWHAEVTTPSSRRSWGTSHSLDYLTLADWEIGGDEFLDDNSDDFEEYYPKGRMPLNAPKMFTLQPFAYDKTPEDLFSNSCEFFMGLPGTPYAFSQSSFTPAEFFPCQNTNDFELLEPAKNNHKELNEETSVDCNSTDTRPNPEGESKLSREKLRLDLPTLCLAQRLQESPVKKEDQNFSI